jgi:hypothetical protein
MVAIMAFWSTGVNVEARCSWHMEARWSSTRQKRKANTNTAEPCFARTNLNGATTLRSIIST